MIDEGGAVINQQAGVKQSTRYRGRF